MIDIAAERDRFSPALLWGKEKLFSLHPEYEFEFDLWIRGDGLTLKVYIYDRTTSQRIRTRNKKRKEGVLLSSDEMNINPTITAEASFSPERIKDKSDHYMPFFILMAGLFYEALYQIFPEPAPKRIVCKNSKSQR